MRTFRLLVGLVSLALFAGGFNLLAWSQTLFGTQVLVCFGAGLATGLLWMVLRLMDARAGSPVLQGREAGALNATLGTLFFLGICVLTYLLVSRWDTSWDLTKEGRRELAPQTVQVLQNMDTQVDVICFFLNVDEQLVRIARDKTVRFLDECKKHTALLNVEVKDPQVAVDTMQSLGINFASPQGTVVLRAGARKRAITLTGGSPRLEERDFTNALINVLRSSEPKVLYLTGHEERDLSDKKSPAGAGGLMEVLTRESYVIEPFSIKLANPEVPAGTDIVIINNPKGDLRVEEIEALDRFVLGGGRIYMMLDPWVRVDPGVSQTENLRPWLTRRFGIEVGSDLVLSETGENRFLVELGMEDAPFGEPSGDAPSPYRGSYRAEHPITRGFDQIMQWQASRTVNVALQPPANAQTVSLLRTQPTTWAETDLVQLQQKETAEKQPDEKTGPLSLVVASSVAPEAAAPSEDKRDGRIVVAGNSYFASNSQVTAPGNINFLMNSLAWLTEAEDLIAIRPSGKTDPPLLLNDSQQRMIVWISVMLTTQVVAVAGIAMYLLRRRNA
jgi:hypothetical protein